MGCISLWGQDRVDGTAVGYPTVPIACIAYHSPPSRRTPLLVGYIAALNINYWSLANFGDTHILGSATRRAQEIGFVVATLVAFSTS